MLTACSSGSDSNQSPQSTDLGNAVTLSWISPVQNADGSCAHDIRGYQISFGQSVGNYTNVRTADLALGELNCEQVDYDAICGEIIARCSYVVDQLQPSTWYFAVQAYDDQGHISDFSNEVYKEIL